MIHAGADLNWPGQLKRPAVLVIDGGQIHSRLARQAFDCIIAVRPALPYTGSLARENSKQPMTRGDKGEGS